MQTSIDYKIFSSPLPRNNATLEIAARMFHKWESDAINAKAPKPLQQFQRDTVINALVNVLCGENTLVISGTGTGKTFMVGMTLDVLYYHGFASHVTNTLKRVITPFPICYFTANQAVGQTIAHCKEFKHIKGKLFVMNYESLRAKQSIASIMMQWKKVEDINTVNPQLASLIEEDEDALYYPEWNPQLAPVIVIADEVQKLKNNGAKQTKAMQSLSITCPSIIQLLASATPFVKPIECKSVTLALRPLYSIERVEHNNDGIIDLTHASRIERVNADSFSMWLSNVICTRSRPDEYSPAAMERLTNHYHATGNIIHVKDVKFARKSINKHILIEFQTPAERKEYLDAFIEYCIELAKNNKSSPGGMAAILVARMKFKQKSEWLRREHIAQIVDMKVREGKNVIAAFCYVNTLNAVEDILCTKYGYKIVSKIIGGQSSDTRQTHIEDFQSERSNIMLAMLQAGGTGLSLHHYEGKNSRPRFVIMPPVWSIIEMLQMLGRAHRINSASTTHQWILWYKGTIEEDVYARLNDKSLSMRELMRKKEQWSELFTKPEHRHEYNKVSDLTLIGDKDDDEDDEDGKDVTFNTDSEMISGNVENDTEEQVIVA